MNTTPTGLASGRRRGWLVRLRAALQRESLDARLLSGEPPNSSPELAERCSRLLHPRKRGRLAEGLRRVVDEASRPCRDCGVTPKVPVSRDEIEQNRPLLLALSRDLTGEAEVTPRGVIFVDRLLHDGTSPLYDAGPTIFPNQRESLEIAVRHARTALLMG